MIKAAAIVLAAHQSTHLCHTMTLQRANKDDKYACREKKRDIAKTLTSPLRMAIDEETQTATTTSGNPLAYKDATLTVGTKGPTLFQDWYLLDELSHFSRERIPERVVHAKGAGAFGYFEVTHDITQYTAAKVFSEIGKRTPIAVRFSQVAGEMGYPDTVRDVRGFAVKFYTEDGIWDLVGNNTPLFFVRDCSLFPSFIHVLKRNPVTHLRDWDMFWDMVTLRPETTHQVLVFFSDRGIPDSYRHMHGYGADTFGFVNELGNFYYCKFHYKTDQAILIAAAEDEDWFAKITQLRITGELRKACSQTGNPVQPVTRVNTTTRLAALRHLMINETITKIRLDAYIIPAQDDHQTEFVSEHDQRRWFISGFSGSYGDAVVTTTKAALWTDARYHLQADDQADCNWLLMKENYQRVPSIPQWLVEQFPKGAIVGVDPKLIAQSQWVDYQNYFQGTEIKLVEVENNLVDLLWNETNGRPEKRNKDVFILEEKYTGKKWISKVHELRTRLMHFKADAMVVTALDEISWLLNIRGRDIPYSPFVRSYLLVEMQKIFFFVNESQLAKNQIQKHFEKTRVHNYNKIEVLAYENVCQNLSSRALLYKKVLIPSQSLGSLGASRYIYSCVSVLSEKKILRHESPIIFLKAKKNPVEIRGMYNAHIRDAAAMCEFFSYFETRVSAGDTFTELDVVKVLNEFRFEQKDSLGNSFRTIAAYGSNGAMIHYEPNPSTNAVIFKNSTLVLDSGGQYFDGTTDVTRTLHLGTPTRDQKDAYTRVLIGQIQLSTLTFPENMWTSVADVMVRAPLWEVGLDYNHGTSHGVGSFLSVHEPPISMHFNDFDRRYKLRPGYFLSNEPGFYREGEFGVRLENVMEVVNKTHLSPIDGRGFLGFKVITLVPYENKLIDFSLLSVHHVRWLNSYNDQIRKYVGAELRRQKFINGYNWMMSKTEYIPECGHSAIFKSCPILVLILNVVLITC